MSFLAGDGDADRRTARSVQRLPDVLARGNGVTKNGAWILPRAPQRRSLSLPSAADDVKPVRL